MIYSYLRRSKEEQSESSIDTQRSRIKSYCELHDLKVDKEFIDYCSGGLLLEQREQGLILSKLLKKGDSIICSVLDRYSRNHFGLVTDVQKYKRNHIKLIFTDLGDVVSSDSLGSVFYQILSVMSDWYRKSLSEKQLLTKERLRQQRKYLGGRCPHGKDIGENNVLVDCEKQQKEIRLILMMRKQGKKYMEIVREMERYTGRRWFLSFVHKIVQREKILG
jgi:DNA invertase Pin-like site-specific DNA recombinase